MKRRIHNPASIITHPPNEARRLRYQTKRQVSSGGVIVRHHHGHLQVCLIRRRQEGRAVWGLPKGHVECGEDPTTTALREVREETGLVGEPVRSLGSISYWFAVKEEHVRYFKRVHFYLLRYLAGDTRHHDHEVDDAVWLPIDEALERLTYPSERTVLRKAKRALNKFRDAKFING